MDTKEEINILYFYDFLTIDSNYLNSILKKLGKKIVNTEEIFEINIGLLYDINANYPLLSFDEKYTKRFISENSEKVSQKRLSIFMEPYFYEKYNLNTDIKVYYENLNFKMVKFLHGRGHMLDISFFRTCNASHKNYFKILKYHLENGYGYENLIKFYRIYETVCHYGNLEVLIYLENNYPNGYVNSENLMKVAASNGHIHIVKYINEKNPISIKDYNSYSPIYSACEGGAHVDVIEYLINSGYPFYEDDLLLKSIQSRKLRMVQYTCEKFYKNIEPKLESYFYNEIIFGSPEILKYLLENKIIVDCDDLREAMQNYIDYVNVDNDSIIEVINYLKEYFGQNL